MSESAPKDRLYYCKGLKSADRLTLFCDEIVYWLLLAFNYLDIYTADANLERLYEKRRGKDAFDFKRYTASQRKKKKIVGKMNRNKLRAEIARGTKRMAKQFESDPDLKEMRAEYTQVMPTLSIK